MGIEQQLFEYEKFDDLAIDAFQFYDCTLNVDIGQFKKGTIFPIIVLDFSESKIILFDSKKEYTFALKLSIKEN